MISFVYFISIELYEGNILELITKKSDYQFSNLSVDWSIHLKEEVNIKVITLAPKLKK